MTILDTLDFLGAQSIEEKPEPNQQEDLPASEQPDQERNRGVRPNEKCFLKAAHF